MKQPDAPPSIESLLENIYRRESRRVLATLIRLLGDFDLAEEALQDAFGAALTQWPATGIPDNPRAWLVSAGRFKAIDQLRRRSRFDAAQDLIADELYADWDDGVQDEDIEDDRLRLIFTCCHPSLSTDTRVALTLREVCGLSTEEVARAFLSSASTVAQRIVRAKAKIRLAGIPYEVPGRDELPDRLDAVLQVIYLVFNEGYSATAGDSLTRIDLMQEALRLGRLLVEMLPEPEVLGLQALMMLHHARSRTRADGEGNLILLEDQDRSLWDHEQIAIAGALITRALTAGQPGPFALQAAIAALHAEAPSFAETDWHEIVGLYDLLLAATGSAVVALNRSVAIAMRDGPAAGLPLVEDLLGGNELSGYHLAHAARADLCRRLGRTDEARQSYQRALDLASQEPERRFLRKRLEALAP
ncbi:MAG TPA: RNA polymerase sigma factor [Porticoccaceae bacterium]